MKNIKPTWIKNWKSKYNILYADPPWKYDNKITRSAAEKKYSCLSIKQLCEFKLEMWESIPLNNYIADDAVLLMWVTFPMLEDSFRIIDAWGFEYKTVAFVWVKTNKDETLFFGLGNYFRSNAEVCLLGKRGKGIKPLKRPINTYLHQRLRHSEKPSLFRDKIVEVFGNIPRLELFSRGTYPGWDTYGLEM